MADTEQVRDAGRRLATDLRELREERGIDADSILEATRLSADILESFDETALVDHPAFNRVYLRSIVGSYARVLDIDESDVLAALDQALDGRYHGALRKKYLEAHLPDDGPSFALVEDIEEIGEEPPPRPEPMPIPEEGVIPPDEAVHAPASGPADRKRVGPGLLVLIAISVVAATAILWWLLSRGRGTPLGGSQEPVIADTTQTEAPPPPPEPAWIPLGDSIRFDVVAERGPVFRLLVKVDRDLRRPYWIEPESTLTFFARDRIAFERQLEKTDIYMDDELLSDSLIDANGNLTMTRDRARAWLDSLAVHRARTR
jgi:8-oxo-dGTP pyrophosphatase MutT (NUDIX family)